MIKAGKCGGWILLTVLAAMPVCVRAAYKDFGSHCEMGAANILQMEGWWREEPGRWYLRTTDEKRDGDWTISAAKGKVAEFYWRRVAGDVELDVRVAIGRLAPATYAAIGLRQDGGNNVMVYICEASAGRRAVLGGFEDGVWLEAASVPLPATATNGTLYLQRSADSFTAAVVGFDQKGKTTIGAWRRVMSAELAPLMRVDGRQGAAAATFANYAVTPVPAGQVWIEFPPRPDRYLFAPGTATNLTVWLYNLTGGAVTGQVPYKILFRETGLEVGAGTLSFTARPFERIELELPNPYDRLFGAFLIRFDPSSDERLLGAPVEQGYGIAPARDPALTPAESGWGTHREPGHPLMGVKWVRYWDRAGAQWSKIAPEPGRWNWEISDMAVSNTLAAGAEPMPVLGMTPAWAGTNTYNTHYGRGAFSAPENIADWENYCRTVAESYKGRVRHYEIWNEPNAGYFKGGAPDYWPLLQAACKALKAVDPAIQVHAPSVTGDITPFSKKLCELGGLDCMDWFSMHTYMLYQNPGWNGPRKKLLTHAPDHHQAGQGNLRARYRLARRLMEEAGGPVKPISNTEVSFCYDTPGYTPLAQGRDLVKYFVISFGEGAPRVFWYINVLETDHGGPAPFSVAYACGAALLVRLTPLGAPKFEQDPESRIYAYVFKRGADTLLAAWTRDGWHVDLSLNPGGKPSRRLDMWGNPSDLAPDTNGCVTITLGRAVQYVLVEQGPDAMEELRISAGDFAPPVERTAVAKPASVPVMLEQAADTLAAPGPAPAPDPVRSIRLYASDGFVAAGFPFKLHRGRTHFPNTTARIGWKVGVDAPIPPGTYRVKAQVRSSQFAGGINYLHGYRLRVGEEIVPHRWWRVDPVMTDGWNPKWAVSTASIIAEPVALREGDVLSLSGPVANAMLGYVDLYPVIFAVCPRK